MTCCDKINARK